MLAIQEREPDVLISYTNLEMLKALKVWSKICFDSSQEPLFSGQVELLFVGMQELFLFALEMYLDTLTSTKLI